MFFSFIRLLKSIYISTGWQTTEEDTTQKDKDKQFSVFAQSFGKLITQTSNHSLKSSKSAVNEQLLFLFISDHLLENLSMPRVISMKKKRIAQKKLPGIEAIASL